MRRRQFIAAAAAFAGAGRVFGAASEGAPSARFGVLSDIHCTEDGDSLSIFEHALRYFDEMKCDGVVLCGDMADYGLADEL